MPETMAESPKRIAAIDQLRGYAIFGMLLVNAKDLFFSPVRPAVRGTSIEPFWDAVLHQLSHHREAFSYADTIAPLFVFVVGMGSCHGALQDRPVMGASKPAKCCVHIPQVPWSWQVAVCAWLAAGCRRREGLLGSVVARLRRR